MTKPKTSRPKLTMLKPQLAMLPDRLPTLGEWRTPGMKTAARGYGGRWQRERARYLRLHPLCVMCAAETPRRITPASVVDHRTPHKGDMGLFWDETNWQSLCTTHHSSHKQALEKSGNAPRRIGPDGWPIE